MAPNPASAVWLASRWCAGGLRDATEQSTCCDLEAKAQIHAASLGGVMVTYPSTHGVFEKRHPAKLCAVVHAVWAARSISMAPISMPRWGSPSRVVSAPDVCHLNCTSTLLAFPTAAVVRGSARSELKSPPHLVGPFFRPSRTPRCPLRGLRARRSGRFRRALGQCRHPAPDQPGCSADDGRRRPASRPSAVALLAANLIASQTGRRTTRLVLFRGSAERPGGPMSAEFSICGPLKRSAGLEVDDLANRLMGLRLSMHRP